MLGGNLAKKNLRDIVLRIYSGKKHQQTGPLHMASSPDLREIVFEKSGDSKRYWARFHKIYTTSAEGRDSELSNH